MDIAQRVSLLVVLLLLAPFGTASAECSCVRLRTFTPEERQQFWDLRACAINAINTE